MVQRNSYKVVRGTFPQVWLTPYGYMVNARSKKWNLNSRKIFSTEKEAVHYRSALLKQLQDGGAQPEMPRERILMANAYDTLIVRLGPYGKRPEDAIDHYIKFLGDDSSRIPR